VVGELEVDQLVANVLASPAAVRDVDQNEVDDVTRVLVFLVELGVVLLFGLEAWPESKLTNFNQNTEDEKIGKNKGKVGFVSYFHFVLLWH
jgi:hypothetical protein